MLDAVGLAAAIRAGELSAAEACRDTLARAEADELGCLWEVAAERALADADAVDVRIRRGERVGPLGGVPVVVKDCFDVEGLPTSVGVMRRPPPPIARIDAEAVARLRRAGAVVAGKSAMHQLAWGMSGQAPGYPPCRNPLDPTRQPGGSSSGSAVAVSAGIVPLALGTDSGGSVRQPAAWCGVVGLKPTLGAIPLAACAPMAPSFDTGGVLARSVRDCREALAALTGRPLGYAIRTQVRVGVLESAFDGVAADVERACRDALGAWAADGAELVEIELAWERRMLGRIYAAEFAASWGANVEADPRAFSEDVHAGVSTGRRILAVDYLAAQVLLERLRKESSARANSVNVIASPSVPILPPALNAPDSVVVAGRNTRVFNGLGWPALTLPCGRAEGLSVGLQLAALPGCESALLALAESLESLLASPVA